MKKRYVVLVLLIILAPIVVLSCNGGAGGADGVFAQMRKERRAYVATVPFEPPLIFQTGGQMVGPDAELARRVVDKINEKLGTTGIELDFVTRNYSTIVPAVQNREAAFGLGVLGITEERKQHIQFSNPYYVSELVMLIDPAYKDIRSNQLDGAKIGVRSNTAAAEVVQKQYTQSTVQGFGTLDDAVLALRRGDIDVVIDDRNMGAFALATLPGVNQLEIIPGIIAEIECAVGVAQGNTELLDIVNEVIATVQAEDLYAQWLNEQLGERLAQVEQRYAARVEKERQAQANRQIVIRVSKDAANPFDIYRFANLSFVLTNRDTGQTYSTSRIHFRGRVGVSSTNVPPGTYSLSLPRFGFNAGSVAIGSQDARQVNISIRLGSNNQVSVTKS